MTVQIWRGDAPALAQVNALTVGGTAALGQTYAATINGKSVTYTATGADTNATIATALLALLQASTVPEFLEVTWAAGASAVVTGTATTAGKPFTQTSAASGTGSLATATTVTGAGPNDVGVAANWSSGTLPATGDTIVFDSSTVDALYNLSALAAVYPAAVTINASYNGKVGLPSYNGSYYEYRPQYLQLQGCSGNVNVGYGAGQGSGRVKLDLQTTNAWAVNVEGTSSPADSALGVQQALLLKGGKAGCTLCVNKGTVGVAALPGESATVPTLNVGYVSQVQGDATVFCGAGAALTAVNQAGGTLTLQGNVTTFTQTAGVCYQLAGTIATATVEGTLYAQAPGTFATTVNVTGGGRLDCAQDMRSRACTNPIALYAGASLNDPFGTLFAGGPTAFKTVECTLADVTVNLGPNHTYTPS